MLFPNNDDELYQGYLARVYQDVPQNLRYNPAQFLAEQARGICLTYGELNYYSVKKLCHALQLTAQDIFLDLGSGLGKCALQVFMQTAVKQVIGIEAASLLYEQSQQVKLKIHQELEFLWEEQRSLQFYGENFIESDWQCASVIYTCSTCFTPELLNAIGNRINQESTVQKVASLRPLPTLTRLTLKKVFAVECSWDSALCYLYA